MYLSVVNASGNEVNALERGDSQPSNGVFLVSGGVHDVDTRACFVKALFQSKTVNIITKCFSFAFTVEIPNG